MGEVHMDDKLAGQVRQRMRERDTDSLLAIWRREDGEGWSDEAYAIVRETLLERGVTPPEPPAPPPEDEEDVYHSFDRLMNVASWAAALAWPFLGLAAVLLLLAAFSAINLLSGTGGLGSGPDLLPMLALAGGCLLCAFFFVLCQALRQVIYLLLDIEANTRPSDLKRA